MQSDPDRSRVYGAQTPQMFLSEEIKAASGLPFDTSYTDDASVAAKYGIPLSYIDGEMSSSHLSAERYNNGVIDIYLPTNGQYEYIGIVDSMSMVSTNALGDINVSNSPLPTKAS